MAVSVLAQKDSVPGHEESCWGVGGITGTSITKVCPRSQRLAIPGDETIRSGEEGSKR